jgi:hypothetical protein
MRESLATGHAAIVGVVRDSPETIGDVQGLPTVTPGNEPIG